MGKNNKRITQCEKSRGACKTKKEKEKEKKLLVPKAPIRAIENELVEIFGQR